MNSPFLFTQQLSRSSRAPAFASPSYGTPGATRCSTSPTKAFGQSLENPSVDSSAAVVNFTTVKRYAPPNQRNRLLGRRKSVGDRLERASKYSNDGERNYISSTKANSMVDHGGAGVNKLSGESHRSRLIALYG